MTRFLACSHQPRHLKVAPREGATEPSSEAVENRAKRGGRGGNDRGKGDDGGVGIVTETPFFLLLPFFILHFLSLSLSLYLFPLLNLASGHSLPQKAGGGGNTSVALSSSHHPFHPSTRPSVSLIRCVCVCVCA